MRVLLIDDDAMSAALLEAMLTDESDIELHSVLDGATATAAAERRDPDVVLVA